jgi:hypothetical protein
MLLIDSIVLALIHAILAAILFDKNRMVFFREIVNKSLFRKPRHLFWVHTCYYECLRETYIEGSQC